MHSIGRTKNHTGSLQKQARVVLIVVYRPSDDWLGLMLQYPQIHTELYAVALLSGKRVSGEFQTLHPYFVGTTDF